MKKISKKQRIMSAIAAFVILVSGIKCGKPSEASIRSSVVIIRGEKGGSCSGEQVMAPSGESYILTAAHCLPLADSEGNLNVTTEDGRTLKRRVIAEDPASDLALAEGVPGIRPLEIGDSLERFQRVRTFTHGRGYPTYKTEGEVIGNEMVYIVIGSAESVEDEIKCVSKPKFRAMQSFFGKVCVMVIEETAVTAGVVPGSSGGPVVNDNGELVGVVSASDGNFGYLVKLKDIKAFISGY